MPLAEDRGAVGEFGPGREHEAFGEACPTTEDRRSPLSAPCTEFSELARLAELADRGGPRDSDPFSRREARRDHAAGRQVRSASAGIVCSIRRPACAPRDGCSRYAMSSSLRGSRGSTRWRRARRSGRWLPRERGEVVKMPGELVEHRGEPERHGWVAELAVLRLSAVSCRNRAVWPCRRSARRPRRAVQGRALLVIGHRAPWRTSSPLGGKLRPSGMSPSGPVSTPGNTINTAVDDQADPRRGADLQIEQP